MGKFIFIVGGARSGKSRFAQELAQVTGKNVAFIATCVPMDDEMKERVKKHKAARPKHWKTIEGESDTVSAIENLDDTFDTVIIDCLGLQVSNLFSRGSSDEEILDSMKALAKRLSNAPFTSILVSNEVGAGIVPENQLARRFRDIIGSSNQIMSQRADTVYAMHVGIPLMIKHGGNHGSS